LRRAWVITLQGLNRKYWSFLALGKSPPTEVTGSKLALWVAKSFRANPVIPTPGRWRVSRKANAKPRNKNNKQ
jgi:hypothetical protein